MKQLIWNDVEKIAYIQFITPINVMWPVFKLFRLCFIAVAATTYTLNDDDDDDDDGNVFMQ